MGIDEAVRFFILADPDISDSALTIAINKKHGTKSWSHSTNYNLVQVKWMARRVRSQLAKWQSQSTKRT